jgi:hypothetical protein
MIRSTEAEICGRKRSVQFSPLSTPLLRILSALDCFEIINDVPAFDQILSYILDLNQSN